MRCLDEAWQQASGGARFLRSSAAVLCGAGKRGVPLPG